MLLFAERGWSNGLAPAGANRASRACPGLASPPNPPEEGWRVAVDYSGILRNLYAQRAALERAIEQLSSIATNSPITGGQKRRGRKSMGADERQQVSLRMKAYWAARRKEKNKQNVGRL